MVLATNEDLRGVSGIYGVIHRDTGRAYVGHSRSIGARLSKHKHRASHGFGGKFYNAVRKHGSESFDFEILERCPPSDLLAREKFYIQFLDSVNNGFNMAAQPERSRFGVPQSAETNDKVSAALTGKRRKPFSAEHRKRLSEVGKARMADPSVRANLSAKIKGRHFQTAESRAKISIAGVGRVFTAKARAKIGAKHKGKIISESHRAAITEANSIAVIQLTTEGVFVREYQSIAEAARTIGRDESSVARAIKDKSATCKGFMWKFKQSEVA